ncbi:hypothetical protein FRB98_001162 [Tulasnella sp. 332]|nr:hypothetical protein FRB98_001162 [Tulasnella sp. 332]
MSDTVDKVSDTLVLYDIPGKPGSRSWSPNVWKTRLILNYKAIPYRTEWISFPDIEATFKAIGIKPSTTKESEDTHYTCPSIIDYTVTPEEKVTDSNVIALYLDKKYGSNEKYGPSLFPEDNAEAQFAFIAQFKAILQPLVALMLGCIPAMIEDPRGVSYYHEKRGKKYGPLSEFVPAGSAERQRAWKGLQEGLDTLAAAYDKNKEGGGEYAFGKAVTYVDIVVAATFLSTRYVPVDRDGPDVKPSTLDVSFVDFDGVRFRLSTGERKTLLTLSMNIRCWGELVKYGAMDVLKKEYGSYLAASTEAGYHVSLEYDTEKVPKEPEAREALIKSAALLRRHALAGPFVKAFATQKELDSVPAPTDGSAAPIGELMQVHYRDEEAIYVQASHDRVTVIFSTRFIEDTDRIFGKVFLQEFVDARRLPTIQTAPQVLYSNREPPLEIRQVPGLATGDDVGYVTFILFPRHFANPNIAHNTISHIQLFRDNLHYHIKCSKVYMHTRMRARVAEFLKVLNRAKAEGSGEITRKTVTGRTFSSR